jgi:hypothetical protein
LQGIAYGAQSHTINVMAARFLPFERHTPSIPLLTQIHTSRQLESGFQKQKESPTLKTSSVMSNFRSPNQTRFSW